MKAPTIVCAIVLAASCAAAAADYSTLVSSTMDGFFDLYEQGVAPGSDSGLPPPGIVHALTNPDSTFLFRPYNQKNVLQLNKANSTGTLVFASPTPAESLVFATASGYGPCQLIATVHFADGTPNATGSFTAPDWVGNLVDTTVASAGGRIVTHGFSQTPAGTIFVNPTLWNIVEEVLPLPSGGPHPVVSVDLSWSGQRQTAPRMSTTVIFGVSASGSATGPYTAATLADSSFNQDVVVEATGMPPGDATGDGKTNFADLLVLAQNFGKLSGQGLSQGDFNGDGSVGFDDLLVLAQNYGAVAQPAGSAVAPEPSFLLPLAVVIVLLYRSRRSVCRSSRLIVVLSSLAGAATGFGDYSALDLYTLGYPSNATAVSPFDAAGGQLVASGIVGTDSAGTSIAHGLLWNGTGTPIDLNPAGAFESISYFTDGRHQVGFADFRSGTHAVVWSGTADSFVDLAPTNLGFSESVAYGVAGTQQVGNAEPGSGLPHAVLWNSSGSSVVDLNPTSLGFNTTFAMATNGIHQVGYGFGSATGSPNIPHALLWSGTAASAVDLNPTDRPGFYSRAVGVGGNQQVGIGGDTPSGQLALLWTGTPQSMVILNPPGFTSASVNATNGVQQVGRGGGPTTHNAGHALLWSGTPDSVFDLHTVLPSRFVNSQATTIDAAGDVFGLATDATLREHVIEWIPRRLAADANADGVVDFNDLLVLAQHYGTATGATYRTGDFNHDGNVNFDDLLILSQSYGQRVLDSPASVGDVPEPSTAAYLATAYLLAATGRRACNIAAASK